MDMQRPHSHEQATMSLSKLSDDVLLRELHVLVASHRRATSALVEHLGEVDARRLHVEKGFSSLFSYCVERLRFSEDEACRRIDAARLVRRFPAVLPLLEGGAVSLTVLGLLKPHLTDENHAELLAGVSGASVRRAKEWLAARFPQPDVPSTIRKLPDRHPGPAAAEVRTAVATPIPTHGVPSEPARNAIVPAPTRVPVATPVAPARTRVEPLSADRFLVKFTASRVLRDKLDLARDLMLHANPSGELSIVVERAIDVLIAELQKKRQGRTDRPRTNPLPAKSDHVTRSVRREVVARDGWQCSFVSGDGRRCDACGFLEFDHEIPKGRGGGSHSGNLRVLCRAHNRWEAERVYGSAHIAHAMSEARQMGAVVPRPASETQNRAK